LYSPDPLPTGRPRRFSLRPRLFPALAALFVGLPLLDLVIVILLGRYIGLWQTIALILISGFAGAWLAKRQGMAVWRGIQRDLAEGRVPAQGLVDGAILLVAGGMLSAPGFITDLLGLALLFPAVRAPLKAWLRTKLEAWITRQYGF
jgi:UPF0716 protein FxsA